jgi:hypothetical protein
VSKSVRSCIRLKWKGLGVSGVEREPASECEGKIAVNLFLLRTLLIRLPVEGLETSNVKVSVEL